MKVLLLLLIGLCHPTMVVKFDVLALKKCPTMGTWSIHGIWPEYSLTTWPQWCDPTRFAEFTPASIKPIELELLKNWYACPDWTPLTSMDFWRHEWEKHGTCTNSTVLEFFRRGLDAYYARNLTCCQHETNQCLIPLPKNGTHWLGWCP